MKILSRIPLVGSWFGKKFAAEDAASAPAADKPAKSKTLEEVRQTRRRIVWACIGTYLGANFVMFLRFFYPRTLFEPKTEFSIGYPGDFAPGVTTKFQKERRIWVVRVPGRLFVVYANGVGVDDNEVRTGNAMILDPYGEILVETWKFSS